MATVGPARAIVAAPAGGGVVKLGTRPVNGEQRCQESTSTNIKRWEMENNDHE